MKYETVHQLLGEGNFVLLLSEGYFHGVPRRESFRASCLKNKKTIIY